MLMRHRRDLRSVRWVDCEGGGAVLNGLAERAKHAKCNGAVQKGHCFRAR
jgi:hypothetical protein